VSAVRWLSGGMDGSRKVKMVQEKRERISVSQSILSIRCCEAKKEEEIGFATTPISATAREDQFHFLGPCHVATSATLDANVTFS